MADILPEPAENPEMPTPASKNRRSTSMKPQNKQTFAILVGLIIVAVLAIVGGYIYDVVSSHNDNNTRRQDLAYIATTLKDYHELNQFYPTLAQLNSSTFSAFSPLLDHAKFKDPNSNNQLFASSPAANVYSYQPTPANCNNTSIKCTGYTLTATLSDGTKYVLSSPVPSH